ncbi:MAG TPA: FG-GAP-like repeat-containing protein, partial [Gemmataceae bacterium]|nr:FG-GAP-like repeat-containing protein [Gemmataceae bacterium]
SRWRLMVGFGLLLLVVAGALTWAGWWYWKKSQANALAALEANNRGVGHMERFDDEEYLQAVAEFERVVRLAPDWLPGKINLGIALLNAGNKHPELLERAKQVFGEVLAKEPDNPYAHFCLGILLKHQRNPAPAIEQFEAVTRVDPEDPSAWFFLGTLLMPGSERAAECFRKAHELDPYQRGALHQMGLDQALSMNERKALQNQFEELKRADWLHPIDVKYGEMGRYATVIGRRQASPTEFRAGPLPRFERRPLTVRLADGATWATGADFGKGEVAEVRAAVRARFGGTVVVLDYNGDGKPDLFLAGAVVEKGQVRDLLLRNDGGGTFTDVTAAAGLAGPFPTLGCCVADFDNDGRPDLLLTGVGGVRLFRNTGKNAFEDVTAKAGMDKLTAVCLTAAAVDLDQDSDLDLLVCEYAATPADALKLLKGEKVVPSGGLAVYLHEGEAEPARGPNPPPLKCHFKRATTVAALQGPAAAVVGLAVSDLDGDQDLDFLVLADGSAPAAVLNDRLLHFRRQALPESLTPPGAWNGALVLDADHDGRSDLLLLRARQQPLLLLNRAAAGEKDVGKWFTAGTIGPLPLRQAVAVDVDMDSWTDVVGLSEEGSPVLLRNVGGRLVPAADAFGPPRKGEVIGLAVLNALGTGRPDVLLWSESEGLQVLANAGNGQHGLQLRLAGRNAIEPSGVRVRCNADGVGAWVVAQAGEVWAGQENTTLSAGLGQSRQPLLLGLAQFSKADVVRLRWPDLTLQAELNIPTEGIAEVVQKNRKSTSCPILFAWDGRRFGFVTDFLGAGSMGELGPDGSTRPPRPEESVKIEAEQLVPRDGQYVLKVAEPMDEVTYLDRVQLVVLDHPADVRVYPDERFADPPPSQKLFSFKETVFPESARDHRGRDVTAKLRAWDRDTVDGFAKRAWIGFAEEHAVELDFGGRLAAYGPADRLVLCLAGWTEYPYPESIWAAQQAGVAMLPPVLERQGPDGRWQKVCEAGFPAGLPKLMTLDVTGKLTGPTCRLRLRTNLQVFWDQIFVAAGCRDVPVPSAGPVRATALEVSAA